MAQRIHEAKRSVCRWQDELLSSDIVSREMGEKGGFERELEEKTVSSRQSSKIGT
jgi:hypothetical protein